MGKSYKKQPWCTDGQAKTTKARKKQANRKVRHKDIDSSSRNHYKKFSNSYDIHDYKTYEPWSVARERWLYADKNGWIRKRWPTLKSYYRSWSKCYRNK